MIAEYKAAFNRCYPDKTVDLKPKKMRNGEIRFRVIVDKDPGDMLLTQDDLKYATQLFERGRKH